MGAPEILCYQPFSRANQNEWERWKPEAVGKGLGQFGMVWGNLGRMDILSPAPPEDGVSTKHGHAPSRDPIGKQN